MKLKKRKIVLKEKQTGSLPSLSVQASQIGKETYSLLTRLSEAPLARGSIALPSPCKCYALLHNDTYTGFISERKGQNCACTTHKVFHYL